MFVTESFSAQLDDLLHRVCVELQISLSQHQLAEERYETVGDWLNADGSPIKAFRPIIYPQGSLRIGTTVRPSARQEFDLDIVLELPEADWEKIEDPTVLIEALKARLEQNTLYRGKVERKNRCVRLKYADEFHLDILPACPDLISGQNCVVIPDRKTSRWVSSNPKGFAQWFDSRAELMVKMMKERGEPLPEPESAEKKAPLRRVVQLMKRWRDIFYAQDPDAAPVSIILTALAGLHYGGQQSVGEGLATVLEGIIDSMPSLPSRLVVVNPANSQEYLSDRWEWNPTAYRRFAEGVVDFRDRWRAIQNMRGIHRVAGALQDLFGEKVTDQAVKKHALFLENQQAKGNLGVQRGSGTLTSLSTLGAVKVRPHSFYGA